MKQLLLAGLFLILSQPSQPSQAALVTFGFSGQLGLFSIPGISPNSDFSGYYTFDTDTSRRFRSLGGVPEYVYDDAIVDFELNIAGGTVTGGGVNSDIIVANNRRSSGSFTPYDVYGVNVANLTGNVDVSRFSLSFSRNGNDLLQLLTDNSIQLTPPDFNLDSGGSNGALYALNNSSASLYLSSLEIIETPVIATPLPATLLLFFSGLFGLFGATLKRNK